MLAAAQAELHSTPVVVQLPSGIPPRPFTAPAAGLIMLTVA
jgi:hypothetical protein